MHSLLVKLTTHLEQQVASAEPKQAVTQQTSGESLRKVRCSDSCVGACAPRTVALVCTTHAKRSSTPRRTIWRTECRKRSVRPHTSSIDSYAREREGSAVPTRTRARTTYSRPTHTRTRTHKHTYCVFAEACATDIVERSIRSRHEAYIGDDIAHVLLEDRERRNQHGPG